MKKIFYAALIVVVGCITFFSCSKDNEGTIDKKNALALIKKDLALKKYYPNEKNKYDYSSVNFKKFINQNYDLVNNERNNASKVGDSVSLDTYKAAVVSFYANTEHDSKEVESRFNFAQSLSAKYGDDYGTMLDDMVENGTIPQEEEDIILDYVDYFFITNNFNDFVQITSTFTYYVNNSNFSELEKRGMLTIFDTFKANKDLLEKEYTEFKFLQLLHGGSDGGTVSKRDPRPNHGTKCAGDVLVPMLGGAAIGNGLGFVVGFATGMWTAYSNGCMD